MRTNNDRSRPVVRFDKESAESAKTLIANMIVTPKQVERGIIRPVPVQFLNAYFDVFDNPGGRTTVSKRQRKEN